MSNDTREALAAKLRGYIGQVKFARRQYVLLTPDEAKAILAALTEQPAPQAEPLTLEEIRQCYDVAHGRGPNFVGKLSPFSIAVARAIEAAHGIGAAPAAPAQEPQQPARATRMPPASSTASDEWEA